MIFWVASQFTHMGLYLQYINITLQSKDEDHSLVKPRGMSISLYKNIILCHIRDPKCLPTANIELHPKSEPVTTQKISPGIV
jgi:hypothetical protein